MLKKVGECLLSTVKNACKGCDVGCPELVYLPRFMPTLYRANFRMFTTNNNL